MSNLTHQIPWNPAAKLTDSGRVIFHRHDSCGWLFRVIFSQLCGRKFNVMYLISVPSFFLFLIPPPPFIEATSGGTVFVFSSPGVSEYPAWYLGDQSRQWHGRLAYRHRPYTACEAVPGQQIAPCLARRHRQEVLEPAPGPRPVQPYTPISAHGPAPHGERRPGQSYRLWQHKDQDWCQTVHSCWCGVYGWVFWRRHWYSEFSDWIHCSGQSDPPFNAVSDSLSFYSPVAFCYPNLFLWPLAEIWTLKIADQSLQMTLRFMIMQSILPNVSVLQTILSAEIFTETLNHCCDLDPEHNNPIFSLDASAYDNVLPCKFAAKGSAVQKIQQKQIYFYFYMSLTMSLTFAVANHSWPSHYGSQWCIYTPSLVTKGPPLAHLNWSLIGSLHCLLLFSLHSSATEQ